MTNERIHDSTTSNVLAWSAQGAHIQHAPEDEAVAEVDEPPDERMFAKRTQSHFKRNAVPKVVDHSESLLTKALHHTGEEPAAFSFSTTSRRRSMNSSISIASTADLTSDTGFTSPARTSTPSPPPPVISLARLNAGLFDAKPEPAYLSEIKRDAKPISSDMGSADSDNKPKQPSVEAPVKKRCISFACGPKPEVKKASPPSQPAAPKPAEEEKPQRKPCIKFACPAKPPDKGESMQREEKTPASPQTIESSTKNTPGSPSTVRKLRSSSSGRGRSQRSLTPRPISQNSSTRSTKYLTANSGDLNCESSRFHEFASDEPQEEDWIRQNYPTLKGRLTIHDTLRKENEIRRLGKEAEDEALEEEGGDDDLEADVDQDEADPQDDDAEEEEDEQEEGEDLVDVGVGYEADDHSGYGSDDDASDGYNTDNEIGFADSDDEDDGDVEFWTPGRGQILELSGDTPIYRRPSLAGSRSGSSSASDVANVASRIVREKTRQIKIRPGTPELPDSTDFVCGTLDEDRALEDAYISCVAARRQEKLHLIPQDIDPSFPTSEPEDEGDEAHKHGHESDDHLWLHGELEDLHHERDHGCERRRRKAHNSPKRYRSPPPRRHHSPPPKARGRSPRRLADRHSPRPFTSPAPLGRPMQSPPVSPVPDGNGGKHDFRSLAFPPASTYTKSLPRAPAMFPHNLKGHHRRAGKPANTTNGHVRGAIDIVKGLEQKRLRRKEKFKEKYHQKHCHRARKGQVAEKKPQPGQGAERMREIGLLMAGKRGPDQFVLSI